MSTYQIYYSIILDIYLKHQWDKVTTYNPKTPVIGIDSSLAPLA